jgi:valyl-tRNA synthetase
MNFSLPRERIPTRHHEALDLADRWILSRLQGVIAVTRRALEDYRFNDAASELYQFFWHEFCDWYLEVTKLRVAGSAQERLNTQAILWQVFETSLRLMHPFIPFLTEELWQQLPRQGETIVKAPYPGVTEGLIDEDAEQQMAFVMQVISALRNIRSAFKIPNATRLQPHFKASLAQAKMLRQYQTYIVSLANISDMAIEQDLVRPAMSATAVLEQMEIYVPLAGLIDVELERTRLKRDLQKFEDDVAKLEAKLARRDFLDKAPEEIIEKEQTRYQGLRERAGKLVAALESIQ